MLNIMTKSKGGAFGSESAKVATTVRHKPFGSSVVKRARERETKNVPGCSRPKNSSATHDSA